MAQIAHADHHQMMVVVHTQNVADLGAQLLHVIAVTLLAELTEAAEILPDLRGGDVHFLTQRVGGDAYHFPLSFSVSMKSWHLAVVY